jgi:hypothetical protein
MPTTKAKRGTTVWLITWITITSNDVNEEVAAILNPRWSPDRVAECVEFIYATREYTLSQRLRIAAGKWKDRPKAQWDHPHGVPWKGRMFFYGSGRDLCARTVHNFRIEEEPDGSEKTYWDEPAVPPMPSVLQELRGGASQTPQ